MNVELMIVRFIIHGFGLGYIMGLLDGWDRRIVTVLAGVYFLMVLALSFTVKPSDIANSIMPSIPVLVMQAFGAIIGYELGRESYRNAFGDRK